MSLRDQIEQFSSSVAAAAGGALIAAITWLVRCVLTNRRQIELLQLEIKHRADLRGEDREAIDEVRSSVKRIESVLMDRSD